MNRIQTNKKNKMPLSAIIFWGILAILVIVFFVVMSVKWYKASKILISTNDIEHINYSEVFEKGSDGQTYYVLFYTSDSLNSSYSTFTSISDKVIEYANYVNSNKASKIYMYNVNTSKNEVILGATSNIEVNNIENLKLNSNSLPVLIEYHVNSDSVSYVSHTMTSDAINQKLDELMGK